MQKNKLVLEIQAPDQDSARLYVGALTSAFENQPHRPPLADGSEPPVPIRVRVDVHDKTKIVATYTHDPKEEIVVGDVANYLRRSVTEAGDVMSRLHQGRMGIHVNDVVINDIIEAVSALQELNEHERNPVLARRLAFRGTGKGPEGRSF